MIIVSQDKETIVNFNNISIITQVDGRIGVTNNATTSTVSEIGVYKTEERAKEVLQEIINYYRQEIEIVYTGSYDYRPVNSIICKVYEMPKE